MKNTSVRPADRVEEIMKLYGKLLFRLCLITLGNATDAEDVLRFRNRHPVVDIADFMEAAQDMPDTGIMDALMTLPEKFRIVLILYYVEEYSIDNIAKMIGRTSSAVKMRLQKGRRLLKEAYGKEHG